jgi:AcrR family transcriptional regulator
VAESPTPAHSRRSRGTRKDTESALVAAALRLLERDRILAGINLREVAAEAGVNHGQIYQYFGTRQALLRAAIADLLSRGYPVRAPHWELPYKERKRAMWKWALDHSEVLKLHAVLALDDVETDIFPDLDLTRKALQRDKASGALPPDADAEVVHALTSIVYFGYNIFRTAIARKLEISEEELDQRAEKVYNLMLEGVSSPERKDSAEPRDTTEPSESPDSTGPAESGESGE